jgi:hypothetical protein
MGYWSESVLPKGTRSEDVQELVEFLGFHKHRSVSTGSLAEYLWFEEADYKSYSGVALEISRNENGNLVVETRTPTAASYWDRKHQNHTIRTIRKYFNGTFTTDAGRGRYWHPEGDPPLPAQSGCAIAFDRFGGGLFQVLIFLNAREFP